MPLRTHKVLLDYSLRPEFISVWRFLRGGHLLDLDWLWPLTVAEVPLHMEKIFADDRPFYVGMTDVESGEAVHVAARADNLVDALKASSALPLLYRGFPVIDGRAMTDGGVTDAIPVRKAIEWGAHKIMVIRSRTREYRKRDNRLEPLLLRGALRQRPALADAIRKRVHRYNEAVELIRRPPVGVTVIEGCPPDTFKVARAGRNATQLRAGYELGRREADGLVSRWSG
jgi:predicted patatin/cPLA2 family phospholipase